MGQIERRDAEPVADLTAQVSRQHRQGAKGKTVAIEAGQKQDERQMHDERIDFLCAVCAEQQKRSDIHRTDDKREAKQTQNVLAVHAHAEKSGGNKHTEQKRCGVVHNAEHSRQHGEPPSPSRNISAK